MSTTEANRRYAKELREWRKSLGICTRCGKFDAEPGKTMCLTCLMDSREYGREYYRKKAKAMTEDEKRVRSEKTSRRYHERKELGICPQCSRPRHENHAYCYEHYISMKRAQARHYRKKHPVRPPGTCKLCGGEPVPGHKMCPVHYKEYSERMTKLNKERSKQKK